MKKIIYILTIFLAAITLHLFASPVSANSNIIIQGDVRANAAFSFSPVKIELSGEGITPIIKEVSQNTFYEFNMSTLPDGIYNVCIKEPYPTGTKLYYVGQVYSNPGEVRDAYVVKCARVNTKLVYSRANVTFVLKQDPAPTTTIVKGIVYENRSTRESSTIELTGPGITAPMYATTNSGYFEFKIPNMAVGVFNVCIKEPYPAGTTLAYVEQVYSFPGEVRDPTKVKYVRINTAQYIPQYLQFTLRRT